MKYSRNDISILKSCTICPHTCGVNRFDGRKGICNTDAGLNIAAICVHRGEEPSIGGEKGICNIFFGGCNLHCVYCQNHEISRGAALVSSSYENIDMVIDRVEEILLSGIKSVGFVSPSHVVPQVKTILEGLKNRGLRPVTVYNTNGYDKVETLRSLNEIIDIYLPDFKYVSPELSKKLSGANNYPAVALKAIKEMYYQKGSSLLCDESGQAESGLLIRHLVLPGQTEESKRVLRTIAEELSPGVHLSLMSQYHPIPQIMEISDLNRSLYKEEYESVVDYMNSLGFRNGYVQDTDSNINYQPDFRKETPFE